MKKVFLIFLLLTTAFLSNAQTYKGQFMVGGDANFNSSKFADDDESTTQITFNPNFGYFFANNFAGGLRIGLSSVKEEDEEAFSTSVFSPFLRYYFLPPTNKTNIFTDVSYGFGSIGAENKESFNQFAIVAGPALFLTPNTALEFGVGYTSQGGDAFGDERYNSIGLRVGFQIHLGRSNR
jgi:hypothetical protein